jgi:DNA helicase-2/ATP-dependent DNA helicase PcrA
MRYRGTEAALAAELKVWRGIAVNPTPEQLVVAAYRRRLKQNNAVDFGGILHFGKQLLDELNSTNTTVADALLCDEIQDATPEHETIYAAVRPKWRFSCGDEMQSIYSFMGADVGVIKRESQVATVLCLATSYRCSKAVCQVASRLQKAAGSNGVTVARPDAPQGSATVTSHGDFNDEVTAIAVNVRTLKCERDCAVLLRTNAEADAYREALRGFGLPIAEKKKTAMPSDWGQVRSLLAALLEPDCELAAEALVLAWRGKEAAEHTRRQAIAAQQSLNDFAIHLPRDLNAEQACQFVASKQPSAESTAKLQAAMSLLEPGASIGDLIVALAEPEKETVVQCGIQVLTGHGFKGGEAAIVFVPNFCDEAVPGKRKGVNIDEERRWTYVAFTRAKENLLVSYHRNAFEKHSRGNSVERTVSRFAAEAGLFIA